MPKLELPKPLEQSFYDRPAEVVARELLGAWLISRVEQKLCVGRIVETEAYLSDQDPACHAHQGRTKKNDAMFGPPGRAYVYAIHAKWCFNAVTEPEHTASAVLIRAVEPLVGLEYMRQRRQRDAMLDLTRGPARLCQAFALDKSHNHWNLTLGKTLWIGQPQEPAPVTRIVTSGRIGISSGQALPLRYFYAANSYVSGRRFVE